jgi:hypothetical protein
MPLGKQTALRLKELSLTQRQFADYSDNEVEADEVEVKETPRSEITGQPLMQPERLEVRP